MQAQMSYFSGLHNQYSEEEKSIEQLYEMITDPESSVRDIVAKIRSGNKGLKGRLPAVTPSGLFEHRAKADLLEHTGLFVIDLDAATNNKETLDAVYMEARQDPYVCMAFRSPSDGVKIIVRVEEPFPVDADEHRDMFDNTVCAWFKECYAELDIDSSGSGVSRLCFLSHDPDAYLNLKCQPLKQRIVVKAPKITTPKPKKAEALRLALEANIEGYVMKQAPNGKWDGPCPRHVAYGSCPSDHDGFVIYPEGTFSCRGCTQRGLPGAAKHYEEIEALARSHSWRDGYATIPKHHPELVMKHLMKFEYADDVRHSVGIGFRIWDGSTWQDLEAGDVEECIARISGEGTDYAREVMQDLHRQADEIKAQLKDVPKDDKVGQATLEKALEKIDIETKVNKVFYDAIFSAGSHNKQKSIRAQYSNSVRIDDTEWNTHGGLIVFPNGTFDTRTMTFRESNKEDYMTGCMAYPYDPAAKCPNFERMLERVLPDEEVRKFFQRYMGYASAGIVEENALLICAGDGANGKSVTIRAIAHAMGNDHAKALSPNLLLKRYGAEPHPTEIMTLAGTRLAYLPEAPSGKLDEGKVKRLTGGDVIRAHKMHKDEVEFRPTHTFVVMTNTVPEVSGRDQGIWRRLLIVPWDVTIPEEEQDKKLTAKLEKEAPGILNWLLEGVRAYHEQGLNYPEVVKKETAEYRESQDILDSWRNDPEYVMLGEGLESRASEVNTSIARFYKEQNLAPLKPPRASEMKRYLLSLDGVEVTRRTAGMFYTGFSIVTGEMTF